MKKPCIETMKSNPTRGKFDAYSGADFSTPEVKKPRRKPTKKKKPVGKPNKKPKQLDTDLLMDLFEFEEEHDRKPSFTEMKKILSGHRKQAAEARSEKAVAKPKETVAKPKTKEKELEGRIWQFHHDAGRRPSEKQIERMRREIDEEIEEEKREIAAEIAAKMPSKKALAAAEAKSKEKLKKATKPKKPVTKPKKPVTKPKKAVAKPKKPAKEKDTDESYFTNVYVAVLQYIPFFAKGGDTKSFIPFYQIHKKVSIEHKKGAKMATLYLKGGEEIKRKVESCIVYSDKDALTNDLEYLRGELRKISKREYDNMIASVTKHLNEIVGRGNYLYE